MAIAVGFIGVGNMGNPMASNVLKAGFPMTVYDRNPRAMENLVQAGARHADSAREVVEASDLVLTSLPASPDVEAVYLESGGLVDAAKPGTMLIDLSSVLPSTPRKIEPQARARGRILFDDLLRVVLGRAVEHYDLHALRELRDDALERLTDEACAVERSDAD